jgi:23S rRNA (cytosine1962-C5)-methyltransferase
MGAGSSDGGRAGAAGSGGAETGSLGAVSGPGAGEACTSEGIGSAWANNPRMSSIGGVANMGAYNASMSRMRATNLEPTSAPNGEGRDSTAKAILCRGKARPLWFGHPWVYANALDRVEGNAQPGDVLALHDSDDRFIGRGLFNPRSQIPVRLLTRKDEPINAAFFQAKLQEAQKLRAHLNLPSKTTTAYRLVNSEGDGLPGLVVDVLGDAAVVQITTLGLALRREMIFDAIEAVCKPLSLFEVAAGNYADMEGFVAQNRVARGQARNQVPCLEDGLRFEAEPLVGQKTGMFLDQRPSRMRVGQLAAAQPGLRMLDCYAYAGGFALQAARAGASEITAVDSSARAVARIEAHAQANGAQVRAVEADVFRFLETATPLSYDLVVIDPPKFARARKDLDAALKGYERLNSLALTVCAPGATLVTCSCSQNVNALDFERMLAAAAKQAQREVRIVERSGPGGDHPLPPGFTEGQYLKVIFAYVA